MRITYIKLENVAGLNVAKARPVVEIDFTDSDNRIILLHAINGKGKSTLLSALQPFANVTSLDERSSIPFIIAHKPGYKEIRYLVDGKKYVIKHYFKPNGNTHTVKSYFTQDSVELNENGNVGSFMALVETHFGLTPDMIRLIRLGTNVDSFVKLRPAERKNYIGKLIDEIDIYLMLHRKISDKLRLTKLQLSTNTNNLQDCHVDDPSGEGKICLRLAAEVQRTADTINELKVKLSELDRLVAKHDIEELRQQRDEARVSLNNFEKLENDIVTAGLTDVKLIELSRELNSLMDRQIEMISASNAIKISIDSDRRQIEQLRVNVSKITSDADITSLVTSISDLERLIGETDPTIKNFEANGYRSENVNYMISRLTSLNQIGAMLISFGMKPISLYLSLREAGTSIDGYLKEQAKRRLNHLGEADIKQLLDEVFQGEFIISPNCDEAYSDCPYYRFSRVLTDLRDKAEGGLQEEDVLRYLKLVATNVDMITNETERLMVVDVPDGFKLGLAPKTFLGRLTAKLSLFSINELQDYLTMLRGNEIYRSQLLNLDRLKLDLKLYRSSGADRQLSEINSLEKDITAKLERVTIAGKEIADHSALIAVVERKVALVTNYSDAKRYQPIVAASLNSAEKLLKPLETASEKRSELQIRLSREQATLTELMEQHRSLEQRLDTYHRLIDEGKELSKLYAKQIVQQEGVSTKRGIPLIFVKVYEAKIRSLTNALLKTVYGDHLKVLKFNITETEFEIPVEINGTVISDIRFTSQSEVALITVALSFAISYETNERYNIPLLDEIDGALDDDHRTAFLRMLDTQLGILSAEQCFIISHNLAQIANLPMDVILLGDEKPSKLQRVIYQG